MGIHLEVELMYLEIIRRYIFVLFAHGNDIPIDR